MDFLYLTWDVDPRVISDWNTPRWYGIFWVVGLYMGFLMIKKMFKAENVSEVWLDKIFLYTILGAIIGARLGHCLFYGPYWDEYNGAGQLVVEGYLSNPLRLLYIWEGGLASHGGALGVIITSYIFSRKIAKRSVLWILDRLVIAAAIAACSIRIGNLFNHEIVGLPTSLPWGVHFTLNDSEIIPRHPAQVYEAIAYLLIFGLLCYLFWRTNAAKIQGFLLGVFFMTLFGARFLIEFIKENQGGIDADMDGFNMGQYLSIPLFLIGMFLVFRNIKEFKMGQDFDRERKE